MAGIVGSATRKIATTTAGTLVPSQVDAPADQQPVMQADADDDTSDEDGVQQQRGDG